MLVKIAARLAADPARAAGRIPGQRTVTPHPDISFPELTTFPNTAVGSSGLPARLAAPLL
jgi:hypothetical protein